MPAKSDKERLRLQLENHLMQRRLLDCSSDEDNDDAVAALGLLSRFRYMNPRGNVPRSSSVRDLVMQYEERQFKSICKMNKHSFVRLVELISGNDVFNRGGTCPQRPAAVQVMIALERLGSYDNGAFVGKFARTNGVDRGTVTLDTDRAIQAIFGITVWPLDPVALRERHDNHHQLGLPGAIKAIDGTHVNFTLRPHLDPASYWSRKHRYLMNVQNVCDSNKQIIYFVVGFPDSVFDNIAFAQSQLAQNPSAFLSPQ